MAIEMRVLFAGKLPSKTRLTRKMKELGFPFSIVPPLGSLETQKGYMPMRFRGEDTGVEFDVFEDGETLREFARVNPERRLHRSANFRWGGDATEMLCGMCACAALATLVDGLVLDEFSPRPLSPDEAIESARTTLASIAPPETTRERRPGTRPADLRRYLKPLLKARDDLVLIERYLVIRPVRHLLRGVFFDRSERHSLDAVGRIRPLYLREGLRQFGNRFGPIPWRVDEPYFQALLETLLAQDAFERVGKVTTLSEFGAYLMVRDWVGSLDDWALINTMLLAGERERAAEQIERVRDEYGSSDRSYREFSALLDHSSRDVESFCAQYHAQEASAAKELKLEKIWEPSPFPIELPVAARRQSAEAFFSTTPWVVRRPSQLMELPAQSGDVRFAIDVFRRGDRLALIAPLTAEEAEERHHASEKYVLAARLDSGLCLVLKRELCTDPNDPLSRSILDRMTEDQRRRIKLWIALQSSSHLVETSTFTHCDRDRTVRMYGVDVFTWKTKRTAFYRRLIFPDDGDPAENTPASQTCGDYAVTAADQDIVIFPLPAFGEYADLAERMLKTLRMTGYELN